jgi:phage terminase small subunit
MPLLKNHKHEQFCQAIHQGKSYGEAHKIAGFSGDRRSAWTMRRRSDVVRRLDELNALALDRERAAIARAKEKYAVTTERLVAELARIGFSNIEDYLTIDSNGEPKIDLAKATRDEKSVISEIMVDTYMDGRGEDAREVRRVRIKLHDKIAALNSLGRHLGLFADPAALRVNTMNFFSEKPLSMTEWRRELELEAKERDEGSSRRFHKIATAAERASLEAMGGLDSQR